MRLFPFIIVSIFLILLFVNTSAQCVVPADHDCDGSVNGKPGMAVGALPCA